MSNNALPTPTRTKYGSLSRSKICFMFPVKRIRGCHRQSNQRELEKIHQATYIHQRLYRTDGNAGLSHILRCQRRLIQSANWGFTSQERRIIYYSSIVYSIQHYTGFTCIRVSFEVSNAKRTYTYHRSFAQYSRLSRITKASMKASHRQ